jgi:hypothetical protein
MEATERATYDENLRDRKFFRVRPLLGDNLPMFFKRRPFGRTPKCSGGW